jgi:hypothetical protein
MNIQPIVEGHGEVPAVPILLRRLRDMCGAFGIEVNRPIRATRSQLVREDTLKATRGTCAFAGELWGNLDHF